MYPELAVIMKIIFTLSHPQTNVERGFNDNNVVLKQNQKHETVVSRRFLKNYMTPNNLLLHTLPVTQKLVKPFKSSWRRHRQHLEDKKKKGRKESEEPKLWKAGQRNRALRNQQSNLEETIKAEALPRVHIQSRGSKQHDASYSRECIKKEEWWKRCSDHPKKENLWIRR